MRIEEKLRSSFGSPLNEECDLKVKPPRVSPITISKSPPLNCKSETSHLKNYRFSSRNKQGRMYVHGPQSTKPIFDQKKNNL